MTNQPNRPQSTRPPSADPSVGSLFLFLGLGIVLALSGLGLQNASAAVMRDPYAGCNQVGCAPGALGAVALLCYLAAIVVSGLALLGLIYRLNRILAALVISLGALWLIGVIIALFRGYRTHSQVLAIFLILAPAFLVFAGINSVTKKKT